MIHPLCEVAAKLVLGMERAGSLPSIAVSELSENRDSPALLALAVASADRPQEELVPLFDRVLDELGLRKPSPREAALLLARQIAFRIIQGELSPYQGSKQISSLSRLAHGEVVGELHPFIYAQDEWEERPEDRPFFEEAIRQAAADLVENPASLGSC